VQDTGNHCVGQSAIGRNWLPMVWCMFVGEDLAYLIKSPWLVRPTAA